MYYLCNRRNNLRLCRNKILVPFSVVGYDMVSQKTQKLHTLIKYTAFVLNTIFLSLSKQIRKFL